MHELVGLVDSSIAECVCLKYHFFSASQNNRNIQYHTEFSYHIGIVYFQNLLEIIRPIRRCVGLLVLQTIASFRNTNTHIVRVCVYNFTSVYNEIWIFLEKQKLFGYANCLKQPILKLCKKRIVGSNGRSMAQHSAHQHKSVRKTDFHCAIIRFAHFVRRNVHFGKMFSYFIKVKAICLATITSNGVE